VSRSAAPARKPLAETRIQFWRGHALEDMNRANPAESSRMKDSCDRGAIIHFLSLFVLDFKYRCSAGAENCKQPMHPVLDNASAIVRSSIPSRPSETRKLRVKIEKSSKKEDREKGREREGKRKKAKRQNNNIRSNLDCDIRREIDGNEGDSRKPDDICGTLLLSAK